MTKRGNITVDFGALLRPTAPSLPDYLRQNVQYSICPYGAGCWLHGQTGFDLEPAE